MSHFDGTPGDYMLDPPPDDEACPLCGGEGVVETERDEHPYRLFTDCECRGVGHEEEPFHDAA